MYPYIIAQESISILIDGRNAIIDSSQACFKDLKDAIIADDEEDVRHIVDKVNSIRLYTDSKVEVKGGCLYYNGQRVHNHLANRILEFMSQGLPYQPMLNFLENLLQNPSKQSIEELYIFLEHSKLPITPEGKFIAYKSVRDDFTDHRTGTYDNSVGKVVSMARNQVCDKRDITCSEGLHFCSKEYFKAGMFTDGRFIVLEINPKDVVSIPNDYNNAKGRCCEYYVREEFFPKVNGFQDDITDKPLYVGLNDNLIKEPARP